MEKILWVTERVQSNWKLTCQWSRAGYQDAFAAAKLNDTNKVSNHSVRKTSVGGLLEEDVQPNFIAQLSGHKNLNSLDSYHSASLKQQREMPAIQNCEPGTSAQCEENHVSTSTTTQQNVFTVQQIQLQAIFSRVHIDKFEGWMRTDHWAIEAQTGITYIAVGLLVACHKLLFQPQAFSLSPYEKFCLHSLTKFVQSWTLNGYFRPVRTGDQWEKKAS